MRKLALYIALMLLTCCFSPIEAAEKCTTVTVEFCDKGTNSAYDWLASAVYHDCDTGARQVIYLRQVKNTFRIRSGTYLGVGQAGTTRDILDSNNRTACPRGDTFNVYCGGSAFTPGADWPYCMVNPKCAGDNNCICTKPVYPLIPDADACPLGTAIKKPDASKKPAEGKKR